MSNLMQQFMNDAADIPVSNEELMVISKLAMDQQDLERRVVQMESDLETVKEGLRNIQEYLLPEAMLSIGMSEFKLSNGSKITIKNDVYASVRKDFIGNAVAWLDENGLGGIVKDQVAVDFGRGCLRDVDLLMEYCVKAGLNVTEKLSIHPATLKATVKEQLAIGVEFPEEYFSIAPVKKAIIKSK